MSVMLSEHLHLLSTAPDGIQNLRGLILELAIRGKLVPQNSSDEPASELLGRIAQERTRLESEGISKKAKPPTQVGISEIPYKVPEGWSLCRFSEFASDISTGPFGSMLHQSDYVKGGIPVVNPSHMVNGRIVPENDVAVSEEKAVELSSYRLSAGDIVMARRGEVGRTAVVTEREKGWLCGTGSFVIHLNAEISRSFVVMLFRSPSVRRYLGDEAVGTTMVNLNHGILKNMPVAIPPIAEQRRIVDKVHDLMALCDRLAAEQTDAKVAHANLVETLLSALTQSADANDFIANWQRLTEHFAHLFTTELSLDVLKQAILQLAVMGKLTPQNANDEPASVLLERIKQERTRLEVEGICKKSKPMSPVREDERPFELPDGWIWARWNDVAQKIGDIDHKMPETVKDGIPYVSPRDFYPDNRIDFKGAKKISQEDFLRLAGKIRPTVGDIIYPRYGTIGENRLVVDELEFLASYSCCVIKTLNGFVDPKFQYYFSISQCCREQAKAAENKTTQANVGIKSIQEFAIPLPPLAEQHRIVTKVDELMTLCDRLKADLVESHDHQSRLASTLIDAALEAA